MIEPTKISEEQIKICEKYELTPFPTGDHLMVGISKDFLEKKVVPMNGLRHQPEGDGSGWFFWLGYEIPNDPKCFLF